MLECSAIPRSCRRWAITPETEKVCHSPIDGQLAHTATNRAPAGTLLVTSPIVGKHLGLGYATVAQALRRYRVKPWRREKFKFSTDPKLEAKVRDILGRYPNPPAKAIVLCADAKSQIQALNRNQAILPMRPGLPEKGTHAYQRSGTADLSAALAIANGKAPAAAMNGTAKRTWTSSRPSRGATPDERSMASALTTTPTNTTASTPGWSRTRMHKPFNPDLALVTL